MGYNNYTFRLRFGRTAIALRQTELSFEADAEAKIEALKLPAGAAALTTPACTRFCCESWFCSASRSFFSL